MPFGAGADPWLQEHARDSFENLLFSVCRFREVTGRYPAHITVVSFEFKHERIAGLHAKALRWPLQRLRFLGTPALSEQALQVCRQPLQWTFNVLLHLAF